MFFLALGSVTKGGLHNHKNNPSLLCHRDRLLNMFPHRLSLVLVAMRSARMGRSVHRGCEHRDRERAHGATHSRPVPVADVTKQS